MRTTAAERDEYEETELRLGLPGANNNNEGEMMNMKNNGKRGFSETVDDLKLNLASSKASSVDEADTMEDNNINVSVSTSTKPPAKAQVVGWPPVRSFRKNILAVKKTNSKEAGKSNGSNANFVKVSVDGVPYLRKVELKNFKSYQELSEALSKMFSSFTIGNYGTRGLKDFMNESKLIDILNGSEYVPTYGDKDGD